MIKENLKQNIERKTKTREEMKNLKDSDVVILEHCEYQHEKSAFRSKYFQNPELLDFVPLFPYVYY